MAKIYHAEIFGTRKKKYEWLEKNNINSIKWKELKPQSEFYLFIKSDSSLLAKYNELPKVTEIFPVNSVGIVTARDSLTIQWTKEDAWKTVKNFAKLDSELARATYKLGKDTRDWKVKFAQKDLNRSGLDEKKFIPILYRPFDLRYTYFTGNSRGFHCTPRGDIMKHMLFENKGLITVRQVAERGFNHCYITEDIVECRITLSNKGYGYLFPLYLYPDTTKEDLFSGSASGEKEPNIAPEIFEQLKTKYKKVITAEQIFYYIYAVLYSNTYRTKYAEFLKIDFPRIPFTKDYKLFIKLGELGKELADLHLLKSKKLNKPIAKFDVDGSNEVDKVNYDNAGKVYINKEQYFEPVPDEVWNYHIGGYQVCHKWLKDRKGRKLTLEEREIYCKIVTALYHTIEIQKQIDELYDGVEK